MYSQQSSSTDMADHGTAVRRALIKKDNDDNFRGVSFDMLPDCCLVRVLDALHSKTDRDAASLVCRKWRVENNYWCRQRLVFCAKPSPADLLDGRQRLVWHELTRDLLHAQSHFLSLLSITIEGHCSRSMEFPDNFPEAVFTARAFTMLISLELMKMPFNAIIDEHFVRSISTACPVLENLILDEFKRITNEAFCRYSLPSLRYIILGYGELMDPALQDLLLGSRQLEYLALFEVGLLKGWGLRQAAGASVINRLHISGSSVTLPELLQTLQGLSSRLISLHLEVMRELEQQLHVAGMSLATTIAENFPCIQELGLYELSADVVIAKIVMNCPRLRFLNVQGSDLSQVGWDAIARHCLKLEELDARYCPFLDKDGLLAITNGCPHLQLLSLTAWLDGSLVEEELRAATQEFRARRPTVIARLNWASN